MQLCQTLIDCVEGLYPVMHASDYLRCQCKGHILHDRLYLIQKWNRSRAASMQGYTICCINPIIVYSREIKFGLDTVIG